MEVRLLRGEVTIIDDSDFPLIGSYRWRLSSHGYAVRSVSSKRYVTLSNTIMDVPKGMVVDHINRNRLDNRRCNLRIVTRHQNSMNISKRSGTASKFIGVYLHRGRNGRDGMWHARIENKGKKIWIGSYYDEAEAALAYDDMAKKIKGEYANLNFPQGVTNATT